MQARLILTVGLPGSGKSHYAQMMADDSDRVVVIERDITREHLTGSRRDFTREPEVTTANLFRAQDALRAGKIVIVSDTNLRPRYRREWAELAASVGIEMETVSFLHVSVEVCAERDALRLDPVGLVVIEKMNQYLIASGQVKS